MVADRIDRIPLMGLALEQARLAAEHGDIPVGAVVVDGDGRVLSADHNRREQLGDPTAHAELLALRTASTATGSWRLEGCTLVVTLEPCVMCAGASVISRLARVVYGAPDLMGGGCWSLYNIPQDRRLNHMVELEAGVRETECAALLTDFFQQRR